jgi:hypothetical protein
LRTAVTADDVVIQDRFKLPSLLFRHLSEMLAAIQALLFASHGEKNNGGGKFRLAEDAAALQAYGGTAAIVVRSGRGVGRYFWNRNGR